MSPFTLSALKPITQSEQSLILYVKCVLLRVYACSSFVIYKVWLTK
jgi:hypothetical protein